MLRTLASSWPAFKKWPGNKDYIKENIGNGTFEVYLTTELNHKYLENRRYHFNIDYMSLRTYSDFLELHAMNP